MATQKSNTALNAKSKMTADPVRPLANFPSSIWGDRLLSLSIDNSELKTYGKVIEKQKQELRRLIIDPSMDSNKKLSLINSVYRLGLTYLFEEEIEGQLDKLFKELDMQESCNEADLYTISVNFQVFRQHGYRLSCDVFNKFKDYTSEHKFKEYIMTDVRGMLGLYESTQLRVRGETILEEAFAFTESQLKGVLDTLEGNIARQVKHALTSPFHRGLRTVEARIYFSNHVEECSTYDSLLKLANAHFNYLQLQHKEELGSVIKWGEDMDFKTITPYARDRIPDLYLWGLGLFSKPHYSQARILISKMAQLICVLDDTYDAYATIDELQLLTNAINRWELSATKQLPEYMKPLYKVLLNEHAELEKQLSSKGKSNFVNASKQAFQELAMGYLQEAEWRHNGQVLSFQEYMKNGLITSTYNVFAKSSLICMSDIVTEEACTWYDSGPKILQVTGLLGRVYNDISTFQRVQMYACMTFERKRAQQQITSIEAYMKTFGVPENVALEELKKMVEIAWNDINEGCLNTNEISKKLLAPIVNLARMTDVIYRYNDKFTFPEKTIEEYITLLFFESIPKY